MTRPDQINQPRRIACQDSHVIVTGGSSGIGAAIAELYTRRGYRVSLIARTAARLEKRKRDLEVAFGPERVHIETADVRDRAGVGAAIARCEQALGPCEVLVAAAGMVEPGRFETLSGDEFEAHIATNLLGPANAIRTVLPGMKSRGSGSILIIGSGAGLIGLYGYSAYCASKAGLAALAEALRQEARPHGIVVSICMPPDTDTPQLAAELPRRPAAAGAIIGKVRPWSAASVAESAVDGMERGKAATYPGFTVKALGYSNVLTPLLRRWFDMRIRRAERSNSR